MSRKNKYRMVSIKNTIHFLAIVICFPFLLISCLTQKNSVGYKYKGKIPYTLSKADETLLDSIQQKTFLFFQKAIDNTKGIVKDRAADWAPCSIAATGFGLSTYAVAAERGWISRSEAADHTLRILRFFAYSEQSTDSLATGYKGFYYHFLNLKTGKREWRSELSTVDTGLLLMGVIFSRNYFNGNSPEEKEIRELAALMLGRLDWDFFYLPPTAKQPHTISMAWKPDEGILNWGWHGYDEALFLYILAAGTGMTQAEKSYAAWQSYFKWKEPYPGLAHVTFPPLFGHQFSACFIDTRGLVDPYMKDKGISYFENSRRATLVQKQYAIENPKGWKGYDALTWGVTASDGPGDKYNFGDKKFNGYAGRGTSGRDETISDDGTLAPYGPLSSIPFTPQESIATIKNMLGKYGDKIWGSYGFYDSFNPTANWVDNDFLGIDQGPLFLMIENFRSGMVWKYVMKDPVIEKGLKRLNFEYVK